MLKKLFVTAAAAAAVSVPLAGVAWADPPSDPDSSSNPTNPKPNNPQVRAVSHRRSEALPTITT